VHYVDVIIVMLDNMRIHGMKYFKIREKYTLHLLQEKFKFCSHMIQVHPLFYVSAHLLDYKDVHSAHFVTQLLFVTK